ncbi:substance-P receptor-like [Actinia tenebrosa]|uniref:Substance-P receptor-like n=1 Tax=Actinia tenebrosa TaxID=6105 RepID=A0A6P8HMF4_ACTTE|nr:substance-P receptor-like [Actinia tenebrosa]XP_031557535.1 substance-P receptor-like [Actinia tenebrosa]XP_031557537.1 substance-P receptor-like [Actinia tenebrosa]XP_031557538.1 substance-P receptor-like [Actinia tenebrosa]
MENTTNVLTNNTGSPTCAVAKPLTAYEKWASVAFYIFIILFDLVGNSLVIIIVQRNQRMKNATNYLIVNMSVTEILSTLINLNMSMAAFIIYPDYPPYVNDIFALILCKTLAFMDGLTHSLSTLSLTVIAFDRFFAVKYPLKRIITRGRAKKIIALIWLLSCIASSPLLYASSYENKNQRLSCPRKWGPFPVNSYLIYVVTHLVLFYIIPLAVMGVLYSVTVYKLWSRRIPGNVTAANQRVEQHAKTNVLKMCITVVVVFALCWLPLFLTHVILESKVLECGVQPAVYSAIVFLAHTYYAINPYIYFAFSKDYRRGLRHIFRPLIDMCGSKQDRDYLRRSHVMDMSVSPRTDLTESGIEVISFRSLGTKDIIC